MNCFWCMYIWDAFGDLDPNLCLACEYLYLADALSCPVRTWRRAPQQDQNVQKNEVFAEPATHRVNECFEGFWHWRILWESQHRKHFVSIIASEISSMMLKCYSSTVTLPLPHAVPSRARPGSGISVPRSTLACLMKWRHTKNVVNIYGRDQGEFQGSWRRIIIYSPKAELDGRLEQFVWRLKSPAPADCQSSHVAIYNSVLYVCSCSVILCSLDRKIIMNIAL